MHIHRNRVTALSLVRVAAVSGQRLGKHVPAATGTNATKKIMFSVWSMLRCSKQGAQSAESLEEFEPMVPIGGWVDPRAGLDDMEK
jgi:hypothetical protein